MINYVTFLFGAEGTRILNAFFRHFMVEMYRHLCVVQLVNIFPL